MSKITVQIDTTEAMESLSRLRESLKVTAEEMRALRTIHERTASRMVSGVIGEHGPEIVQFGRPEKTDVQAAILEELRAIRGLLEKQQAPWSEEKLKWFLDSIPKATG